MKKVLLTTLILLFFNNFAIASTENKPIVKINNKYELNDKVLNIAILPTVNPPEQPKGIIYFEDYKKVDEINPQKWGNKNANYPGLRGPNQLIIYTPKFALRTGTNEFGTEAIVENNMVVRLNGADSVIPKNGFVISGHGSSKKWIEHNIKIGSIVYPDYQNKALKVFLTSESLMFEAKEKLKEVKSIVEYYEKRYPNYDNKKALDSINEAVSYIQKAERKPEKTKHYTENAIKNLDEAIKNAIPYIPNELKGIWVRPTETNKNEIERTIEKLADAGITDIFLETYFHGKTIYPSKYLKELGLTEQREEFKGFDPLEIWIEEAHKKNIKIHIWFETYYLGNENPQNNPNHILSLNPSWANKRLMNYKNEQPQPSLSEHNGYFLDPANVQVKNHLQGLIKEIINNYNPDGINLDYIRYPQTVDTTYSNYQQTNWGYTKYAREEFKYLYGIDPVEINYNSAYWKLWTEYRQGKISNFIEATKGLTKPTNIMLTAVIFPDLNKSKSTKMQNWHYWSEKNLLDGLTPLIMTGDKNTANLLIKDIIRNTSQNTKIYAGLFVPFMDGGCNNLLLQIHQAREYKTKGNILFDYAHFDDKYIDALTTRVYNKKYEKPIEKELSFTVKEKQTKKKRKSKKKKNK